MVTISDSASGVTLGSSLSLESTQVETPVPDLENPSQTSGQHHQEVEVAKIERTSVPDPQKTPKAKQNTEKSSGSTQGSVTQVDRNAQETLLSVCEMMLIDLAKLTLSMKEVQSSMTSLSSPAKKKKKSRRSHDHTSEE